MTLWQWVKFRFTTWREYRAEPVTEPAFTHSNGVPCHGCQSCLAGALEDYDG